MYTFETPLSMLDFYNIYTGGFASSQNKLCQVLWYYIADLYLVYLQELILW